MVYPRFAFKKYTGLLSSLFESRDNCKATSYSLSKAKCTLKVRKETPYMSLINYCIICKDRWYKIWGFHGD
jgi:hypothetical protein